jgi:hypothetical protein
VNKLNHMAVRILTEDLLHAQAAVTAFAELDSGFRETRAHGVDVPNLERHVVGTADARPNLRFRAAGQEQVELAITERIPGSWKAKGRPFDLSKPQGFAEKLARPFEVANGEGYMMELHQIDHENSPLAARNRLLAKNCIISFEYPTLSDSAQAALAHTASYMLSR